MAPLPVPFSDLIGYRGTFAIINLSISHTSGNTSCSIYDMFTHESIIFSKMKGFSRSQPVMCIVNVVMSRKQCQIASLLLQTTNRNWCMTYWIEVIPMTLSHLQGHSYFKPFKWDFVHATLFQCNNGCHRKSVQPSICSSQVGVLLRRLNVGCQKTTLQDSPGTLVLVS